MITSCTTSNYKRPNERGCLSMERYLYLSSSSLSMLFFYPERRLCTPKNMTLNRFGLNINGTYSPYLLRRIGKSTDSDIAERTKKMVNITYTLRGGFCIRQKRNRSADQKTRLTIRPVLIVQCFRISTDNGHRRAHEKNGKLTYTQLGGVCIRQKRKMRLI